MNPREYYYHQPYKEMNLLPVDHRLLNEDLRPLYTNDTERRKPPRPDTQNAARAAIKGYATQLENLQREERSLIDAAFAYERESLAGLSEYGQSTAPRSPLGEIEVREGARLATPQHQATGVLRRENGGTNTSIDNTRMDEVSAGNPTLSPYDAPGHDATPWVKTSQK